MSSKKTEAVDTTAAVRRPPVDGIKIRYEGAGGVIDRNEYLASFHQTCRPATDESLIEGSNHHSLKAQLRRMYLGNLTSHLLTCSPTTYYVANKAASHVPHFIALNVNH